ncbi:hypothetical protein DFP72DRAFT_1168110 [Ephemerocybe angulata]|uniref:Uncharacterized protein n=1 Tax=Ephemerocybe angulata TaxID=980116 RepID=A0A8H6I5F8_9AGAR|nr:hypothetical protein DFP72DRAFT_1168110 [Tulosesus angulatus]
MADIQRTLLSRRDGHCDPQNEGHPHPAGQATLATVLRAVTPLDLPYNAERLLGKNLDLPRTTHVASTLHPVLARSETPMLIWDIRTAPAYATILSNNPRHEDQGDTPSHSRWSLWNDSATTPVSDTVTIRVAGCRDNVIVVFPMLEDLEFVRVLDVLATVSGAPRCALGKPDCTCTRCVSVGYMDETMGSMSNPLLLDTGNMGPRLELAHRDMRLRRRRRGGVADGGWEWGGLQASTAEEGIWDLLLN